MIHKTKKKKYTLNIPKNFARIETMVGHHTVIYDVKYYFDMQKAIKYNATQVRITVYDSNPTVGVSVIGNSKKPKNIINSILSFPTIIKTNAMLIKENYVYRKFSDLTSEINNAKISQMVSVINNFPILTKNVLLSVNKNNLEDTSSLPNLALSNVNQSTLYPKNSVKTNSIKLIAKSGVLPSAVGDNVFPVLTPSNAVKGTLPKLGVPGYGNSTKMIKSNAYKMSKNTAADASNSLGTFNNSNAGKGLMGNLIEPGLSTDSLSLAVSADPVIWKKVEIKFEKKEELLKIDKDKISGLSKLYFVFELLGNNGDVIDIEKRSVNHQNKLNEFYSPKTPPTISVTKSFPGKNVLKVRQQSPVGSKVSVYRKFFSLSSWSTSTVWALVSEISLTSADGEYPIVDEVNNGKYCIYRAFASGPNNQKSNKFSWAVTKPHLGMLPGAEKEPEDLTFAGTQAESEDDRVRVRVTNILEGPCAVYVLAREANRRGSERVVGATPDDQIRQLHGASSTEEFEDKRAKPGKTYEYTTVLVYPSGRKVRVSKTDHKFIPDIDAPPVLVSLTAPSVAVNDKSQYTVSFEIDYDFTQKGLDTVVESLAAVGLDTQYAKEITDNRSNLSDTVAFMVERHDESGGLTETFGIVNAGLFVDSEKSRAAAGVSKLAPGRKYRYVVRLAMRNPDTLFDVIGNNVDPLTLEAYKTQLSKFLNPVTLGTSGVLPSHNRMTGNALGTALFDSNPFIQGLTGVERYVTTIIPKKAIKITSINAYRTAYETNEIKWKSVGPIQDLDHFLIMARYEGTKAPVGSCAPSSDFISTFKYEDSKLSDEVGEVQYSIIPVLADYSHGDESRIVSVINRSSVPAFTIKNIDEKESSINKLKIF